MSRMIALGNWLLTRLARGPYTDAVAGDLAEGVRAGRGMGWYWGQVLGAIWAVWLARLSTRRGELVFSVLWTATYSTWPFWGPSHDVFNMVQRITEGIFSNLVALPFPYSTMLLFLFSERIAVGLIWIGLLVYMTIRRWQGSSVKRLAMGLMMSCCIYVLGRYMLWLPMQYVQIERGVMANLVWLWIELMLASSLYCGIVAVMPQHERVEAAA